MATRAKWNHEIKINCCKHDYRAWLLIHYSDFEFFKGSWDQRKSIETSDDLFRGGGGLDLGNFDEKKYQIYFLFVVQFQNC